MGGGEEGGRTEAALGHEGVGVFQGGGAPFGVVKVVGEEFECVGLLVVPRGHAPEALEDSLFAEGEVEEGAVDGVLFVVAFGVFVAGNVFELFSLGGGLVRIRGCRWGKGSLQSSQGPSTT